MIVTYVVVLFKFGVALVPLESPCAQDIQLTNYSILHDWLMTSDMWLPQIILDLQLKTLLKGFCSYLNRPSTDCKV